MNSFLSVLTTISLIFSYILGFGSIDTSVGYELTSKKKLNPVVSMCASQGLCCDGEYFYTSGALAAVNIAGFAKFDINMRFKKMKFGAIPKEFLDNYGSNHVGGIDVYNGKIYASVEGKIDGEYKYNFVLLYDCDTLEYTGEYYDMTCPELTDGIPYITIDRDNGYLYTSQYNNCNEILQYDVDTMEFIKSIPLQKTVNRIQGASVYNGKIYLSYDVAHSTEEQILRVDPEDGSISVEMIRYLPNYDNEAEDICFYPLEDGTLIHTIDYDKLICSNIMHYKVQTGYYLDIDKLDENITRTQNEWISEEKLTGSVVMISQNGETVFSRAYGKRAADKGEMTLDTTFRLASMTKPVTAAALLIARDMGLVDIYADVADYLPEFSDLYLAKRNSKGEVVRDDDGNLVKGEPVKNRIKVYQTVSHTTGLQDIGNEGLRAGYTIADSVNSLSEQPLMFEPGTEQSYNTGAFDVAARIIELKSGMEFEAFLKKYIFDKLDMTDTTFEPSQEQFDRITAIHGRTDEGKAYDIYNTGCVFGGYPVSYHLAGAGLLSTASDYLKFANMLLNNGKDPEGNVIISEESVNLMHTLIPEMADGIMPGNQQWGLGVRVITSDKYGNLKKGCYGWSGFYGTHFWIDPVNKVVAVYCKNSSYDGGAGSQTANLIEKDVNNSYSDIELVKVY